jgi:hypothetical protein
MHPETLVNSNHMTPRNNPDVQGSTNCIPSYSILPGISLAFPGANNCKMLNRTEQEINCQNLNTTNNSEYLK